MEFLTNPLNLVIFFPLVGVLALLLMPSEKKDLLRWIALLASAGYIWHLFMGVETF